MIQIPPLFLRKQRKGTYLFPKAKQFPLLCNTGKHTNHPGKSLAPFFTTKETDTRQGGWDNSFSPGS